MKCIILTDREYEILEAELQVLTGYRWNDDNIHADDSSSVALPIIRDKVVDYGKSTIIQQMAEKLGMSCVDIRCSQQEVSRGLPDVQAIILAE